MESIIPAGGFQLPFQRHLSRLYNDTKKSSDFVKEPVQLQDDPEIKSLYRKLRIQKDRFVSWGLEWSEPHQSADIDESLSKAGLSEVVGSIMSTIKDTLAEAEPLWLSFKRLVEGKRPSPDAKAPLLQWDKDRFKDLIRDLTASIDTLYDLSRTRSSGLAARALPKTASSSSSSSSKATTGEGEFRHFESTRMQTPQQIDPTALTHLQPARGTPGPASGPAPGPGPALRGIVYMGKTAYSDLVRGAPSHPWAPFLLEYAPFDPIFASTGIMPPMARFEKLSSALQQDSQRAPSTWSGLPRLFGYFEDMANSRLGLVYHLPPTFNVLAPDHPVQNPRYVFPTLAELLLQPGSEPPLEAKFRLAQNLANTVFDMHARGITHGNLADANVSFCPAQAARPGVNKGDIDVRHPLLSSFDVFPDDDDNDNDAAAAAAAAAALPEKEIWRHSRRSPTADERVTELYSLAMLLLSVGLWTRLEDLVAESTASPRISDSTLRLLSLRCGTLYTKAVQTCWQAAVGESADKGDGESFLLSSVQMRVSRFLEACCILDGVSGLEERLGEESQSLTGRGPQSLPEPPAAKLPSPKDTPSTQQTLEEPAAEGKDAAESKTKMRLYPHVPLPPDVVEKWNTILMPQVNSALRSFYRKHPESVEISLESVGPSPHQTRPTVLVVCSSVGKVRGILNKRLGELFDDTTGFALRVCRGHVLRSRRQALAPPSSVAAPSAADSTPLSSPEAAHSDTEDLDDASEGVEAVNPKHQERPGNGASIGAWIGDRHLPPVSFGGLVIVDDKTYGMTVHHMLDDPERDFALPDTMRSGAASRRLPILETFVHSDGEDDEGPGYELSDDDEIDDDDDDDDEFDDDDEEPCSETDLTSEYQSDEGEEYDEPGDIPGIEPGCGEGYLVTQPALDDVEEGFYPCADTEDEDHLDTFTLGELYASSGIRRRQVDGLIHEVDWALFEFANGRQPDSNSIPRVTGDTRSPSPQQRARRHKQPSDRPRLQPTTVAPWSALPGMEVQCMARTSGLQAGKILPALTSVKIYGRTSPSHTYQVVGTAPSPSPEGANVALGIPGDSGAWIVDREQGRLCGHVLAWSQRKRVAYICPMDVLLRDIAQTLEATEVRLPGGEPLLALCSSNSSNSKDEAPAPVPIARTMSAGGLPALTSNMGNVSVGRRIGVHG